MLGGEQIGEFSQPNVDQLRRALPEWPHATTLGEHPFLGKDYKQFLLSVDEFDSSQHREFYELFEDRLKIEIRYESIYGGKRFTVAYPPER